MHFQHTSSSAKVIGVVWIQVCVSHFAQMCVLLSFLVFSYFWHAFNSVKLKVRLLFINSNHNIWLFNSFSAASMGPVYCSRDPQTPLFSNFFIKNGSHCTIYTFKIFCYNVFNFQQNKFYPNTPIFPNMIHP